MNIDKLIEDCFYYNDVLIRIQKEMLKNNNCLELWCFYESLEEWIDKNKKLVERLTQDGFKIELKDGDCYDSFKGVEIKRNYYEITWERE